MSFARFEQNTQLELIQTPGKVTAFHLLDDLYREVHRFKFSREKCVIKVGFINLDTLDELHQYVSDNPDLIPNNCDLHLSLVAGTSRKPIIRGRGLCRDGKANDASLMAESFHDFKRTKDASHLRDSIKKKDTKPDRPVWPSDFQIAVEKLFNIIGKKIGDVDINSAIAPATMGDPNYIAFIETTKLQFVMDRKNDISLYEQIKAVDEYEKRCRATWPSNLKKAMICVVLGAIGAIIGAILGGIAGFFCGAVTGALVGAFLGAALGVIVGSFIVYKFVTDYAYQALEQEVLAAAIRKIGPDLYYEVREIGPDLYYEVREIGPDLYYSRLSAQIRSSSNPAALFAKSGEIAIDESSKFAATDNVSHIYTPPSLWPSPI